MTLLRFMTEARVRQRFGQQKRIAKLVIDSFLERMHAIAFDKFLTTSRHRARAGAWRHAVVFRERGAVVPRLRARDWFLRSTPLRSNAAVRSRRRRWTFPFLRLREKSRVWLGPTVPPADPASRRPETVVVHPAIPLPQKQPVKFFHSATANPNIQLRVRPLLRR